MLTIAKLKKEAEEWDARGSTGLPGCCPQAQHKERGNRQLVTPHLDEQRSQRGCRFLDVTSSQGGPSSGGSEHSRRGAGPAAEPGGGHL